MRVSKAYNASLLAIIARKGEVTYVDLKEEYCKPTPPGIVSGCNVMFDSDLKVLEEESYITVNDGVIVYNQR